MGRRPAAVENEALRGRVETLQGRIVLLERQLAASRRMFDEMLDYKKQLEKRCATIQEQLANMVEINGDLANDCGWKQCEALEARLAVVLAQRNEAQAEYERVLVAQRRPKATKIARKARKSRKTITKRKVNNG